MKLALYSLRDNVSNVFGAPFVAVNRQSALRSCISESQNPASGPLHTHPQDFAVYAVGEFDNETGVFEPHTVPNCIGQVFVQPQE